LYQISHHPYSVSLYDLVKLEVFKIPSYCLQSLTATARSDKNVSW